MISLKELCPVAFVTGGAAGIGFATSRVLHYKNIRADGAPKTSVARRGRVRDMRSPR